MSDVGRWKHVTMRRIAAGAAGAVGVATLTLWCFAERWRDPRRLAASRDRSDRLHAVDLLRGEEDAVARGLLFRLSSDRDLRVAATAVWALGDGHSRRNARMLRTILDDPRRPGPIRAEAAEMLGKCAAAGPEPLIGALAGNASATVRAGAARGLFFLPGPPAARALLGALEDPDARVRREAVRSLYHMTSRRFPYDPDRSPDDQQNVLDDIRTHLREAGALPKGDPRTRPAGRREPVAFRAGGGGP